MPKNCSRIHNACDRPLDRCGRDAAGIDPVLWPALRLSTASARCANTSATTLFSSPACSPRASTISACAATVWKISSTGSKAGKESYYIVSKFEHFEYAKVAPFFANLSQNFEGCVYGLNMVKNDLQEMQHPIVRRTNDLIM